jgi:subtilisin-like proprotein convertase family protein
MIEQNPNFKNKTMKTKFILVVLLAVMSASAGIYTVGNLTGTGLNVAIPDNNFSGIAFQQTVVGEADVTALSTIAVTLNVSGGYNGDLLAYLSYNGNSVTLLNRVGQGTGAGSQFIYGFSTSGFNNITLADGSASSIHDIASPSPGTTYGPDDNTRTLDNNFIGNPNGTWTLFFADLSAGGVSTLQGWSLDITAVPEPVNVALAIFGGVLALWSASRKRSNPAAPHAD